MVPAATAAASLGHSAQEHLRTYAHAVLDRAEINYEKVLDAGRSAPPTVTRAAKTTTPAEKHANHQ